MDLQGLFESVKRVHSLLADEYEALKSQKLDAFEALQQEKISILETLSSSDIVQDPDQPTNAERLEELARHPLWNEITHILEQCKKSHQRNELLISKQLDAIKGCLLYTSPSPRDPKTSRMPSSA